MTRGLFLISAAAGWALAQTGNGDLPRRTLQNAEAAIEEVRDQDTLRATLYGVLTIEELTPDQSSQMMDAASRLFERQRGRVAEMQSLVEAGAMARLAVTPYIEELDRRRRVYDEAASRARLFSELMAIVKTEAEIEQQVEEEPREILSIMERFDGNGMFHPAQFDSTRSAYVIQFGKPMPVSARGNTAVHRSLGFDHSGRVDVALLPDSEEGRWLRRYLESRGIPYYAFRGSMRGKATAPHIHIGPPSNRLKKSD
jgi:hypothetical protein